MNISGNFCFTVTNKIYENLTVSQLVNKSLTLRSSSLYTECFPVLYPGRDLQEKLIMRTEASFCEKSEVHFNECLRKRVGKVFLHLIKQGEMPARGRVEE
jgi:hypothetical protein